MRFENLPRRSVVLGGAAASLVLAACSKAKPKPAASSTSSSTTTTAPPKPRVTGAGLPADLLTALTALYLGGSVPASGAVAAALGKRKPVAAPPQVVGTTGTWKGAPIATVTTGKDLTLLVKGGKGWSVVGGWWPSLSVGRPPMKTMRVLAIGSDARNPQPVTKCRGDALHIIGVDPAKGVGGIVGIPRDSWVPLAGGGNAKINASLVFGGVSGMVHSVSRVSGVQIDGYVITGFKGFRAMVSALGGIVVVASKSLTSVDGFRIVKPGTNRLDAKHALAFARERKHLPNGDFGRSANQGVLIKSGVAMAQKAGAAQLAKLLSRMGPHLQTDLSVEEVLNLSASLYLSPAAKIPNKVVPGDVGTRDGQSVVLLGGGARSVFADMRDGHLRA
ncbi:MAG TPA: LCP family protein [Pedococcus sp.]|nr:LCP family protein [Pedococcus sp.]